LLVVLELSMEVSALLQLAEVFQFLAARELLLLVELFALGVLTQAQMVRLEFLCSLRERVPAVTLELL
jgi:hypothetical protein